jgi:hypothetical protein
MSKSPKQLQNYLKRAETRIVLIMFNGVLYKVCVYTESISHCCSACIRYQKRMKIFVTISYLSIVRVWDTDNIAADEVEETEDDYIHKCM